MTTIAELVDTEPDPTFGAPTGFTLAEGDTGIWRHVVELADPAAGASVEWFDITEWFAGYEYTRGADTFQGRYRAGIATFDLWTDDDRFAPWNDDTSDTFGVHVSLGPGLLVRSGFIRVDGGVVAEWNPRWTCKVEFWGDAAYSRGLVRQHRIVARDTLTSLVGVPIPAYLEENWKDRIDAILTDAGWSYGWTIYGATTIGGVGILPLPDRDAQTSAINELDASADPSGVVWYTNRRGQLIVRPRVDDTYHADKFGDGAAGTPYPTADPTVFAWWACGEEPPPGDLPEPVAAYAIDSPGIDPFGLDRSELSVINHVVVDAPGGTFDDDNPISIQRYDRHTLQASWITANDFVAEHLLDTRANATVEARPLTTAMHMDGFMEAPSTVDYLDPVQVYHRNGPTGLQAFADGWLRSYRELVRPVGCDTDWSIQIVFDVFATESTDLSGSLLPVEDLAIVAVTDTTAEFSWTNPTQVITPTHTQVRVLNAASLWLTVDYPITGLVWSGLSPSTEYEFQVRLLRIVDGVVTDFSPIAEIGFPTDAPTVPHVDVDPDEDEADVTFPDAGSCDLEWELQSSPDGVTWTTIDDGTITDPPFELVYDTSPLDAETFYRFRSREVCAGVPGAWEISDTFVVGCIPVGQLDDPPFDADLVAFWPQVCPPDAISEAVSDQAMTFGPAFDRVGFDTAGLPVMYSFGEGVIGYGIEPVDVPGGTDLTLQCRVNIGTLPDAADVIVFGYGGLYFSIQTSGSGWTVEGHALEDGVGTITITSFTVQALDTEYTLRLSHEVGGDLWLYVDNVLVDSTSGIGARAGTFGGLYQIGAPADSWVTDCGVWDTVLDRELPVTAGLVAWYDADDASTLIEWTPGEFYWNDKSASAAHLNNLQGADPGEATLNGRNVMDYNAAASEQSRGSSYLIDVSTKAVTVFIVAKLDSTAGSNQGFIGFDRSGQSGVPADIYTFMVEYHSSQLKFCMGTGFAGGGVFDTTQFLERSYSFTDTTSYHYWTFRVDTSTHSVRQDGSGQSLSTTNGTMTQANFLSVNSTNWRVNSLGRRFAVSNYFDGKIAEVIVYNQYLNSTDVGQVEGYLAAKWGL